ncbi:protein tweety homolog 1-A [Hemitrygon akajei]|uniref:protein tweety homolog 1-A n=1 Tax=Hemitrygon akajei TaxID=2704970 RepID=UPI003BFA262B
MDGELVYSPSHWALALHQLPRYNLRLQRVDGLFAPRDWEYQQTFVVLAAVTALGLALNLLWLLLVVSRRCRRVPREEEDSRPGELCCPSWGCVTAVVVCCTGIGIGFYGNGEINDGMGQATRSLVAVNHTLANMELLVSNSSATLSQVVREDLTHLEEIFSEKPEFLLPTRNSRRQVEALLAHLHSLVFWKDLGFRLLELAEWGDRVERARWASYLVILLYEALLCLGILLALASLTRCPLIWLTVLAVMALLLSWLGLGVDFAAALSLTLSQRAMSDIHQKLLSLLRGSATELPSAQPRLLSVLQALNASEGMFHHLTVRLHCLGLHKHLQDLWTGLCWDGLEGALGLSVLSLLSVATFSSLAACLPQVWALSVGTRDSATEEEPEEPEELEGEDVFRPPEWKQLPRYLSRPRLHTFSSYGRPSLRAPTPTRPWTPTLYYM